MIDYAEFLIKARHNLKEFEIAMNASKDFKIGYIYGKLNYNFTKFVCT